MADMRYLAAIMVPEPQRAQLLELQHRYRPARWHVSLDPHITLLPPSDAHLEPAAAIRAFEALAPSLDFVVTARQLGRFDHPNSHVLYLAAEPAMQLRDLSQHLYQAAIWQDVQPRLWPDFTPHITLSNKLHNTEVEAVWRALNAQTFDLAFAATGVTLLGREPDWPAWRILTTSDRTGAEGAS
jgi:2'-5' RNA ligase